MKTINLNDRVRVRLTREGCRHYRQHEDAMHPAPKQTLKPGGVWEGPLWELMLIFGEGCYMGGKLLFVDNEITLAGGAK